MSRCSRRHLLRAGAALALGAPFARNGRADEVTELLGQVLADGQMAPGMPARIPGGVIGFANWRYVSPGSFSWQRADPTDTSAFGASFDRIEVPFGIRLMVHVPDRLGPIDLPTPGIAVSGCGLNTVMLDEGVYRGWGYALPEGAELSQLRYFESSNGLDWTAKPWRGQRLDIDLPKRGWVRGHVSRSGDPADPSPYKHVEEGVMAPDLVSSLLDRRAGRIDPKSFRGDTGKVYGLFGAVRGHRSGRHARLVACLDRRRPPCDRPDRKHRVRGLPALRRCWHRAPTCGRQSSTTTIAERPCRTRPTSTSCFRASTTSPPTSSRPMAPPVQTVLPGPGPRVGR